MRQHGPEPIHPVPSNILADAFPYRSTTTCGRCGMAWLGAYFSTPQHVCHQGMPMLNPPRKQ